MVFLSYVRQKQLFLVIIAYLVHSTAAHAMNAGMQQSSKNPIARDLVIILDDKERNMLDATQLMLFQALIAKTAPILVSGELWRNFARARFDFNQNRKISGSIENTAFDVYQDIQTSINRWSEQFGNNPQKIAEMVNNAAGPGSLVNLGMTRLQSEIGDSQDKQNRLQQQLSAFCILFDPSEWEMYHYKHTFYLLIPQKYADQINKISKEHFQDIKFQTTEAPEPAINQTTAILGFKTNEFTKVTATDKYDLPGRLETKEEISFSNILNHLFIQKNNIQSLSSNDESYPFTWNIAWMGHGSFSIPSSLQETLDQAQSVVKEMNKYIEEKIGHIPRRKQQAGINRDEIAKFQKIIAVCKPHIAGIPSNEFSSVLDFFNDSIKTSFLVYFSCHAGSRNLVFPYLDYFLVPKKFNYTIITGTQEDVATLALVGEIFNFLKKDKYVHPDNIRIHTINGKQEAYFIPAAGIHDFKAFFDALRNTEKKAPLRKILNYVFRSTTKTIIQGNEFRDINVAYFAPVIRLPYSDAFFVHDFDKRFVKISRITTSIAAAKTPPGFEIDGNKKLGIMLNTYYIPTAINFVNKLPFSCASSLYKPTLPNGISGYYISDINTGIVADLDQVMNLLLQDAISNLEKKETNENPVPKVFIIDKMTTMIPGLNEGAWPYENVLIFNRLTLPADIIKELSKYINQDEEIDSATGALYTLLYKNTRDESFSGFVFVRNKNTFQERIKLFKSFDLKNEMLQAYMKIYNEYKKSLTDRAEAEGLTLIDVKTVQSIKRKTEESTE